MMTFYRYNRLFHKWVGLILLIQLIFWIGGGTIMALLDIDEVHGDHLHHELNLAMPANQYRHPLQDIFQDEIIPHVEFISINNEPVYKVKLGNLAYFSALDGREMPPLETAQIASMAQALFTRQPTIQNQTLLTELPMEARPLKPPMWRIDFADKDNTSFYMHPVSGELLRIRSDIWRLFDFVWMLHIMDYDERDDFNHPLLISFAFSALLFTLSGAVLIYQIIFKRALLNRQRKSS